MNTLMTEQTPFRHIWLYAKGYYPKLSDPLEAAKILLAHDSGMDPEIYRSGNVIEMLLGWVLDHNLSNKAKLYDAIISILEPMIGQSSIYAEIRLETDEDRALYTIVRLLSIMTIIPARTSDGVQCLNLGEIDPNLYQQLNELREEEYVADTTSTD